MSHHDEATLVAFHDGELPTAEVESIRRHLERCPECRARLEDVRRLKAEALDLIGAIELLEPADAAAAPAMVAAEMPMYRMAMPAAASVSPPAPTLAATGATKRPRRWVTGLAWAATIVLAVGLGYSAASLRREPASVVEFRDAASPAPANAAAPAAAPTAPADSAPATAIAGRRPSAPEPRLQTRSVRPQPAPALDNARAKITAEAKKAEALRDERQIERKDEPAKEKDALAKAAPPAEQLSRVRAENPPPEPAASGRVAEGTVKGAVVDAKAGQPLADAIVVIEGTGTSGRTGVRGDFDLANVPGTNVRLRVARIGYEPRTVDAAVGGPPVRVELTELALRLDELVVTGAAGERQQRAALSNKIATRTIAVTADSAIRTLGGSIKLIDGLVADHYEAQGPLVRVVYRVAWGSLVLEQRRMDTGLRFQLIAPNGTPADSIDAWRQRIR